MDWLKIVNKANKEVEITLEGVIGGSFFEEGVTMEQVNRDLKNLNAIEADTVTVKIVNSPGGSVLHGLGIIDILNELNATIKMKILGMAASMAAEISMVAKIENREMTENSFFLLHRLSGAVGGTIKNVESAIEFMKKNEKKLIDLVVNGTELNAEEVEEIMDLDGGKGEFLTAQEAIDKGLIGKITGAEPVSMAAFTEKEIPNSGLPVLPTNLVKTPEPETLDTESLVAKIVDKVKALFEASGNDFDETKISALIKIEVDALKAEYDPKLANLNKIEIENGVSKAENTRLKAELQKLATETKNNASSDPNIGEKGEHGLGAEILKSASPTMKKAMNKAAEAKAKAEASTK